MKLSGLILMIQSKKDRDSWYLRRQEMVVIDHREREVLLKRKHRLDLANYLKSLTRELTA